MSLSTSIQQLANRKLIKAGIETGIAGGVTVDFVVSDIAGNNVVESFKLRLDTISSSLLTIPKFNFKTTAAAGFVKSVCPLPSDLKAVYGQTFPLANNDIHLQAFSYQAEALPNIVFTGQSTAGSRVLTNVSSTVDLKLYQPVVDVNQLNSNAVIPQGSYITALSANTVTMSQAATVTSTGNATFVMTVFPGALPSFQLNIDCNGYIIISAGDSVPIPEGPHTVLATTLPFCACSCSKNSNYDPITLQYTDAAGFPYPASQIPTLNVSASLAVTKDYSKLNIPSISFSTVYYVSSNNFNAFNLSGDLLVAGTSIINNIDTIYLYVGQSITDNDGFIQLGTVITTLTPNSITLSLPALNTGTVIADTIVITGSVLGGTNGGYLTTLAGALPKESWPVEEQAYLVPVQQGGICSYLTYLVDTWGQLSIRQPGINNGIIPPNVLNVTSEVTLYVPKYKKLLPDISPKNLIMDSSFTNYSLVANGDVGYRDSHVNDSFENTQAFVWSKNYDPTDYTNPNQDAIVCIVRDGVVHTPINLTHTFITNILSTLPAGSLTVIFDTAVAINRKNPKNIIVSFGLIIITPTDLFLPAYIVRSDDGGKAGSWTQPFVMYPDNPTMVAGDCRGTAADDKGNFWFSTNQYNSTFTSLDIYFYYSSDGGSTWILTFNTTDGSNSTFPGLTGYDYPQYCFGQDGEGNYVLWWGADFDIFSFNIDNNPRMGKIPIYGLGEIGTGTYIIMDKIVNTQQYCHMSVSAEGEVIMASTNLTVNSLDYNTTGLSPMVFYRKKAGPLTQDLLEGPFTLFSHMQQMWKSVITYPVEGYSFFSITVTGIIQDHKRKAIYVCLNPQPSYNYPNGTQSQDYETFLIVSVDNGVTWSPKIDISSTVNQNRGYSSMTLDEAEAALYFGWYDARNNQVSPPTPVLPYSGTQRFWAKIDSCDLDRYVKKLRSIVNV